MEVKTIIFIVIILILLYIVVRYVSTDVNTLTSISSGTTMQTISSSSLAQTDNGTPDTNFTYSIWFYINDWNYRYGESKILYGRMGDPSAAGADSNSAAGIKAMSPSPVVVLGDISNTLSVFLSLYPGTDSTSSVTTSPSVVHTCSVENVPIQKWVNLLISVYGRTLDVYLDGKLVRTCVLEGVVNVSNASTSNVYVTPKGGFSGWTSKFQYYANSTDPQTAWNIYQKGYGSSMLSNIFGKYQVKISLLENQTESSSVTL
jgi:hypothetical protein